jgi:hypothetical protein
MIKRGKNLGYGPWAFSFIGGSISLSISFVKSLDVVREVSRKSGEVFDVYN